MAHLSALLRERQEFFGGRRCVRKGAFAFEVARQRYQVNFKGKT
ncbi:hypothetical protein F4827_003107 [Paraburkholderia bannensis]|uniref:Uncharacterized protein n=1 Tax=Paraburkholderia bannensis TaxID=765414 RepID=A0A7W9TXK8_9BURK|nr:MULTISPECIES: hypothetical protein [Paraburkholderia]MBB3258239.1 hypothetical protein [Paraburkholderia sp. WP4_3_2]MBB6103252.1 hypothetical protein [Paraburkholderia bannensis]